MKTRNGYKTGARIFFLFGFVVEVSRLYLEVNQGWFRLANDHAIGKGSVEDGFECLVGPTNPIPWDSPAICPLQPCKEHWLEEIEFPRHLLLVFACFRRPK